MSNVTTHNLGFPRIGAKRELKFALESYWRGESSKDQLTSVGAQLRQRHWAHQAKLDLVPVGDFSFYDQVLDLSFTLGNLPERVQSFHGDTLDNYFRVARGRSAAGAEDHAACCGGVAAGEMTKWFDTNYHYIVPEFTAATAFSLDASRLLAQVAEAKAQGIKAKPVIVGPVTYLAIGKAKDDSNKLALLEQLLPVYADLLTALAAAGVEWVQLLLAPYFGQLQENIALACELPVHGFHLDAINAQSEVATLQAQLPQDRVLSLGVINGRNIWKTDLNPLLDWLEPVAKQLGDRLWIAPSCSLLHVPVDLNSELSFDAVVKPWLAFALQKLDELEIVATALNHGRDSVSAELSANREAIEARRLSPRVNNPAVKAALATITPELGQRRSAYTARADKQTALLQLPKYPTTTIGSFPQTAEIRQARSQFKAGQIDDTAYTAAMKAEIERSVREQEALGLDVLVHGEAERNDMVEYFGEQLDGYVFSRFGWVQSYGSRCVKPPILFGDISRPNAMTVAWTTFAQSLTAKPMKGMLTGPVTILNWSFVRDDQPRSVSCYQLALAISHQRQWRR